MDYLYPAVSPRFCKTTKSATKSPTEWRKKTFPVHVLGLKLVKGRSMTRSLSIFAEEDI